jgi:hypothetical protein
MAIRIHSRRTMTLLEKFGGCSDFCLIVTD